MGGSPDSPSRQGYRFRIGIPAEVQIDGHAITCEAQNLSRSGVLLVGQFPPIEAETLEVVLKAPTGSLSVHLLGRIIRVKPEEGGDSPSVALEFVEMDDPRRESLDVLLARMIEAPAATPFDDLKPGAPPQDIKKALEAIPLPQRIALSSRATVKEREYLRSDVNPAILEALVRNPGLTVAEARVIATSTYLLSGTLDALANDPRFKDDEELRIAVASHPRVSMATAEKVTANFKLPQLKKLLAKPGLNQLLREKLFRRTTTR
jgi:PilZ domain